MLMRSGECHHCGECCETVNMMVVRDVTLRQHGNLEELTRYLEYRGIRVIGEDVATNQLYYSIDIPCRQLTGDQQCGVHNTPEKPLLCLKYPWAPDDIKNCGYTFKEQTVLIEEVS